MHGSDFQDFSAYYSDFFKKVYNYVFYRAGRHRQRAEDMTSEIFLKALENFETFDKRKSFQSWIFRIAHNHVIDYYRGRKPEPADIDDVAHELKSWDRIIDKLTHNEDMNRVIAAMDTLSDDYREVLNLKYFNDLSHEEIAEITEKSEGTVRVWAHRAIVSLKKALDNETLQAGKERCEDARDMYYEDGESGYEKRKPLQSVLNYLFTHLYRWIFAA